MQHIRPHQVFDLLPERPEDRVVRLTLPSRPSAETRSVMARETLLLIAATKIVQAKTIYEFGTSCGATTLNLLMNSEAEITTIDLVSGARDYDGTPYASRVRELIGDSRSAVFPSRVADMVFVDGGHDTETLRKDTHNAFKLCRKHGIVCWHDYGNEEEPDVKPYLDQLATSNKLYHVEDTWLVFWGLPLGLR